MSDLSTQTALVYLTQFAIGSVIGVMLLHFSRLYDRQYLRSWALSAIFFAVYALTIAFLSWDIPSSVLLELSASLLASIFNSLHLMFMLLGIVKETLTKIKGTITMKSEPGKGSAFKVSLEQPA